MDMPLGGLPQSLAWLKLSGTAESRKGWFREVGTERPFSGSVSMRCLKASRMLPSTCQPVGVRRPLETNKRHDLQNQSTLNNEPAATRETARLS